MADNKNGHKAGIFHSLHSDFTNACYKDVQWFLPQSHCHI